ncbi:hypothetical protein [Streptococcus oralis]|jgi:hypothetical protein|uniref:Uncharacterized protein n=1 Tax=Streptococcus oralis ATCC 49296 TaxID=888049 RepID=E6KMX7_STROR|nr:hypothetical protein [Streptococcus oralis]EFU62581.1 hypothetical protein HMPREF8578_1592 [Streptococcus oralis ATCC 49296]
MSEELEIQVLAISEKFNEKKEALKAFSEEIPEQSDLPTVPQDELMLGFIGTEYDVKGKDLNALTDAVQNRMIEQNKHIKKIIQEFNTIYETFQLLDDDYIKRISDSLMVARKANITALQGLEESKSYQENNKNLLNDVIKQNKDLIDVLKKHHDRLEDLETLENSFKDLQVQVNNSQNNLKNYLDEINNKSITEGNNLKLVVEGLETKLEEKQEEIVFLKKGFYTLGVAVVLIVLFLLFKGM